MTRISVFDGTDNTALKLAEEALLKAGALQRAIFNSANFSSIATDAKGVIQIFNVGAERMLGYTAAEVMNKITPADISDPQEVITRAKALSIELATTITPGFEALVFKASRGIEDIYELTYIRKDGSRFPAVVSVTALRDAQGAIIGYLLIGTDNTARKLVEAEQKKLDQRLRDQQFYTRSLIESNIDALMTTDPSGIITDVNKQMEALTGCTRDELIGAPFKSYFTDPERAEAAIKLVLSAKKVTDYELTARARDGTETVVSYNATTFYDRGRTLQGVFAAARDVTERKRVEAMVATRTVLLSEANEELQRFAHIVSHDLRSPLVNIMGFASELDVWQKQIFERLKALRAQVEGEQNGESDEGLRSDVEEALSFIKSSVAKMDRLIAALLKLSREGQRQFQPQFIDMSQLLRSTLDSLAYQAQDVNAKISIGELPTITSDRLALEQVFSNLMDNAVKYLRAGVPGSIEVRATDSDDAITYEVRDNGRGIDAKDRERIFDLFRRSGIQDRPGDGIGLAHARALVRRLGGSINVDSEPDRGAVFKVTLPKRWPLPAKEMMA